MSTLFNGKKIFKWFIRIYPIILLFVFMIIYCVRIGNNKIIGQTGNLDDWYDYRIEIEGTRQSEWVNAQTLVFSNSPYLVSYSSLYQNNTFGIQELMDNVALFMTNGNFIVDECSPLLSNIIYILFYEIFVSIGFIAFDVFNFMINICTKFLNKGENLNE